MSDNIVNDLSDEAVDFLVNLRDDAMGMDQYDRLVIGDIIDEIERLRESKVTKYQHQCVQGDLIRAGKIIDEQQTEIERLSAENGAAQKEIAEWKRRAEKFYRALSAQEPRKNPMCDHKAAFTPEDNDVVKWGDYKFCPHCYEIFPPAFAAAQEQD